MTKRKVRKAAYVPPPPVQVTDSLVWVSGTKPGQPGQFQRSSPVEKVLRYKGPNGKWRTRVEVWNDKTLQWESKNDKSPTTSSFAETTSKEAQ